MNTRPDGIVIAIDGPSGAGKSTIARLLAEGASVKAYDPISIANCREVFPQICYTNNAYEAAQEVDALMIVTEWNEFKQLNMERVKASMNTPLLFAGRNI